MSESAAAPLQRTRADLERVASRGIPGVTLELLESMVGKEIVIVEEKGEQHAVNNNIKKN
nr:hypothetical protein [uncultured Methanoregula sp.]